jgi:hypothetical protein
VAERLYDSPVWQDLRARALARDEGRCTVARLLGGECSRRLDVHHLVPVSEGGEEFPPLEDVLTACSRHHPSLEGLRRYVVRYRRREKPRCPHKHVTSEARRICEARLARVA